MSLKNQEIKPDLICMAILNLGKENCQPTYCYNTSFHLIRDGFRKYKTKCSKCGEIGSNTYLRE